MKTSPTRRHRDRRPQYANGPIATAVMLSIESAELTGEPVDWKTALPMRPVALTLAAYHNSSLRTPDHIAFCATVGRLVSCGSIVAAIGRETRQQMRLDAAGAA